MRTATICENESDVIKCIRTARKVGDTSPSGKVTIRVTIDRLDPPKIKECEGFEIDESAVDPIELLKAIVHQSNFRATLEVVTGSSKTMMPDRIINS